MSDTAAVFNDREVKRLLDKISKNVSDISKKDPRIVATISAPVFKDIIDHFDGESGPDGPWTAWKPSYQKFMKKIGRSGNKKLQFSGRLRQNFKPQSWRKTMEGIIWYNNAKTKGGFPYAYAHNEGGPQLPKREFMWLSDKAVNTVADIVAKWTVS